MGKIRGFIFFIAVLSTSAVQARHDAKECRELEDQAIRLVDKMNSFFDMKIKTEFITKSDGPTSPGSPGKPPSLLDANSAHETLQVPKPCLMSEKSLPSKELWSLIIAHEFSHKIIDQKQDKCFETFVKVQPLSGDKLLERDHINHTNMDVLALKILSQTNIDARKGIWDLGDYVKQHRKEIGDDVTADAFEKRVKYMKQIWPTDFESGDDFLFGEYFDGIKEMNNFILKRFPSSKLVRDLQGGTRNIDGCLIVKPERARQSLQLWRSLDSSKTQPRRSEMPGAK